MQFEWDEAQKENREHFYAFAKEHIAPGAGQRDYDGTFAHNVWLDLAEQGFWQFFIPRKYEGDGGSLWDFLAAFEGLASGAMDTGFVLSAIAHAGLLYVINQHGTDSQCTKWLPPLMSGKIGATAATEPHGGSDVSSIKTSAQVHGEKYIINGEKMHITNAPIADFLLIVGRIPSLGKYDITLFLVERGTRGVNLGHPEDLMGQRTSPTGAILLQSVVLTADEIIGKPGRGLENLYSFLSFDRLMYGIAVAGFIEPLLAQATKRVTARSAFGTKIAEHEYIQEKLVNMKLAMEASRWLAYSAAAALIRNDPASSLQASLAKLTASEGMVQTGIELIQVFGHQGYERQTGIEKIVRDAIAIRMAGGTTEMQKKNIFKHLIKNYTLPING